MTGRRGGWWGIAFVVLLLLSSAMVSLPTAQQSGASIKAFYAAHRDVILLQQVLGALALIPFVGFALSLRAGERRWLRIGTVLVVCFELITNLIPVVIVLANPSPEATHSLTLREDYTDAALFASVAIFSIAATWNRARWAVGLGIGVAIVALGRAILSPLGVDTLDVVAPIAFLVLVLALSIHMLLSGRPRPTSA